MAGSNEPARTGRGSDGVPDVERIIKAADKHVANGNPWQAVTILKAQLAKLSGQNETSAKSAMIERNNDSERKVN